MAGGPGGIDRALLDQAIGGWRGLLDSGLPALVFVSAYLVTDQQMRPAVLAALGSASAILVWRLLRHQPLQQVVSGFLGVAISAFVAARTGRAQDFFLLGMLTNLGYGLAFLVSILVGWPLLGVVVGAISAGPSQWRTNPRLYSAFRTASWIWVGLFFGRLAITVPLYLMGALGALGVAKVVLGWPPFLLAAYLSYRIIHPVMQAEHVAVTDAAGPVPEPTSGD